METIEEKIAEINDYYENLNSETRFWIANDGLCVVCYNALSDMDDIYEVDRRTINQYYLLIQKIKNRQSEEV